MPPRAAESSQSESEALVSQPFEPREDDDQTLYEVIEITGETKSKYKVRWKGNDPETKKPWPQSWVPKRDCTDDLVLIWKLAKKQKKERRNSKKSGRASTSSKRTSRSVVSTAGTKFRSESTATTYNITTRPKGRSPSAGPSNVKSKSKHRFEKDLVKEEEELESADERDLLQGQRERSPAPVRRSNVSPTPPLDIRSKGTKRKREAQSTHSSTNQTTSRRIETVPVGVDSNEGQTTKRIGVLISNPPRKKRRVMSDLASPLTQRPLIQGEKNIHDVQSGDGGVQIPSDEEENEAAGDAVVKEPFRAYHEEEEERMVEVALSDGYHSAGTNGLDDESRNNDLKLDPRNGKLDANQQIKGKEKGKTVHPRREEEEEESDVEFLDNPDRRPPTQSEAGTTIHVRPSKKPSPRMMMPQPPPHGKTPPSNKHRNLPATAEVPKLGSKPLNKTQPAATTKKSKDSSVVAQSSSSLNPRRSKPPLFDPASNSDRSSPPERHRKPPHPKRATKRPRIEVSEVISIHDSDDAESEASLSPGAWQRLAIFDAEVIGKKPRVAEKKRVNEVNNGGEVSALKRSGSSGNGRPATSAVRPTQRFDTQSYNMDVVPETELENSQEDKLQTPSIAIDNHDKRDDVSPIASSTGPSITKPLRPLPHISPSTFHAHLQPPNSSLPDTIVEPSSSLERREIEAIEQFESPEKDRIIFTKSAFLLNKNDVVPEARKATRSEPTMNQEETPKDVRKSDVVPREQEIVEQAEAMRRRISAGGVESSSETTKKKSVQEVVARAEFRTRNESNVSQPDENDDEEQPCEDEGVANASTSVVPPASGPPALSQDQPPVDMPQPMEDNLHDLNGDEDAGEPEDVDKTHDDIDETSEWINPQFLRQEEEEDSQDIIAERRQHQERDEEEGMREINSNEVRDLDLPPVCTPSPRLASINGDTGGPSTLIPAEEPKLASRSSSGSPQKGNQHDDAPRGPITRSRSRSKTPSVTTNSRKYARGKKALKIPSPVPSRRESAEPELELPKSPIEGVQNVQEPSTASSVLAGQISSLQTQVHEKQVEIDTLQQVLVSLREELRSSEDRNALIEADRQRRMTELQSQWANEKLAWEAERTLLATQNAASEQSRSQAEQDREFFREQYGNASAYVTTVREENKELEQRVEIAEGQSKNGVELIKATFELQVAKLQDEAKVWRKMAEFAIQKDIQTNDDIRKRAAEEPELRMLCVRQKKSLKEARAKVDEVQAELQEKTSLCDASTEEVEHCKKENARLQSELNEALIKLDRIGRSGDESTQGDDHEFVYRCMWRVETDNTQSGCPDVFLTMRELEQHLLTGHLARH